VSELALLGGSPPSVDPRPKGDGVAIVYVSTGWWVARCCRPSCDHAEYFGIAPPDSVTPGRPGGLTPTHMMCPACGSAWPARWPADTVRRGVEQILGDRPDPAKRNWFPGETLADLVLENAIHGIAPVDALAARDAGALPAGGVVLQTTIGDEVVVGARALPAGRLAIPGGA
jgi:hypothetical protein